MRGSEHFHRYQCLICGKMFDSEDVHEEHEKKCKKGYHSVHYPPVEPELPRTATRTSAQR